MNENFASISEKFAERDERVAVNVDGARVLAAEMWKIGGARFGEMADALSAAIKAHATGGRVVVDKADANHEERSKWHRWQVYEAAERLKYFANVMEEFAGWVRLCIVTENGRSEILLSFHGIGRGYTGVLGASLCFYRRGADGGAGAPVTNLQVVTIAPFEIHCADSLDSTTHRFTLWLSDGMKRALSVWSDGE
jgi:hypothetical protein